jgi:hypothetical protein
MSTSRMSRGLRISPYGRNVAAVVSAVMEKDRQNAARKRRAVVRIGDPFSEAKRVQGSAKSAATGSSKPAPAAKPAAAVPKKPSAGAKAGSSGVGKPPLGEPGKGRKVPSPARADEAGARVTDFDTDISVADYFVGKLLLLFRLGL